MRKAFLAPWHSLVGDIWLYSLADAQREHDVDVHLTNLVVTHHHTTVTPRNANLPEFLQRLHRDTSCALNTLLASLRYDSPHELFDDRSSHVMRLMDAGAQLTELAYQRNNCVAAGLVQRPEHMPGNVIDFDLWKPGVVVVKKPPLYFSKDRPDELELRVTPPPLLMREFGGDLNRLIHNLNRLSDDAGQQFRAARKWPAMGAQKLQRLHPWSEPRTLRERGGQRVPSFRIGARDVSGRNAAKEAAQETHAFRAQHEEIRLARKAGDLRAIYPFGTYGARVHDGAPCELTPQDTAFVTKPGPLLEDVLAELAQQRTPEERAEAHASSVTLVEEAHSTFHDEANELIEDAAMIFDEDVETGVTRSRSPHANTSTPERADSVAVTNERPERVVVHRFTKRDNDPKTAPRRVVTLRDARRGRPSRNTAKHGADPPV